MKKLSFLKIIIVLMTIGFSSCEDITEIEDCPNISVDVDNDTGSAVYRFVAQIDGIEEVRFMWTVDGVTIDTGALGEVKDQILDYRFEPGSYNVCVKLANEDCPVEVCTDITVAIDENNPCPDLFFEARQYERPSQYKFIADFRGMNEVSYEWFINGEFVEDATPNEDNYLIWEFPAPGRYEVCIATETPECPEGVTYCKVIEVEEVEERCPEISFEKELEPGTVGTYTFEANIDPDQSTSEILWLVDGEVIENATDPATVTNRVFTYQFENGVYEVCLKVITETCEEGVVYCKEVEVNATHCPELAFEAEQDGDNPAYYFYPAAFEGIQDVQLDWFINGDFVGSSSDTPNNDPFYWQFAASGSYEVCLAVETPNCPEGVTYCKTVVIEDAIVCPDLFFEIEQEGDTPGYNFYADFTGIEDVSYEWLINGEYIESEIADSNTKDDYLYYQFASGTYQICIIAETPNCPNGIEYCKTLVVE